MPETSPSVLVIRLDGIGDALALTPLIAAFAGNGIPVDVVLRAENAAVFSSNAVRRVETATWRLRSNAPDDRAAMRVLAGVLTERRYTHALVATEDPSGYRLARWSGIPQRVGFHNGWGKPLKSLWVRSLLTRAIYRSAGLDRRKRHECDVLFQLGRGLVAETTPTRDARRLRQFVLDGDPQPEPRVAFQVTEKWGRLGMPLDRVAAAFVEAGIALRAVPIAAQSERDYADAFERRTGARVERTATLDEWKQVIAASRAVVAPDSGAIHVAGTVGTPVVAVFPDTTDVDLQVARWHPWAAPYRIVRADADWPRRVGRAIAETLEESSGTR